MVWPAQLARVSSKASATASKVADDLIKSAAQNPEALTHVRALLGVLQKAAPQTTDEAIEVLKRVGGADPNAATYVRWAMEAHKAMDVAPSRLRGVYEAAGSTARLPEYVSGLIDAAKKGYKDPDTYPKLRAAVENLRAEGHYPHIVNALDALLAEGEKIVRFDIAKSNVVHGLDKAVASAVNIPQQLPGDVLARRGSSIKVPASDTLEVAPRYSAREASTEIATQGNLPSEMVTQEMVGREAVTLPSYGEMPSELARHRAEARKYARAGAKLAAAGLAGAAGGYGLVNMMQGVSGTQQPAEQAPQQTMQPTPIGDAQYKPVKPSWYEQLQPQPPQPQQPGRIPAERVEVPLPTRLATERALKKLRRERVGAYPIDVTPRDEDYTTGVRRELESYSKYYREAPVQKYGVWPWIDSSRIPEVGTEQYMNIRLPSSIASGKR